MLKVEKKSRKLIKPETPTPDNLKCYNISFLDKLQLPVNEGLILFYGSKSTDIVLLEESLSKILVQFYPLAGRYIKNSLSVDCSDEGAEFIEAEALDVELMELVAKTETADQLSDLFPDRYFRVDEASSDPILSIQATHFPCGGLTIAISVCHRVFDVSSLATFISAWSSTSIDIILNSFKNMGEAYRNSERIRNVIIFSDWSKFGFYDADFGWGKPVWTAIGKQRIGSNLTTASRTTQSPFLLPKSANSLINVRRTTDKARSSLSTPLTRCIPF